MRPSPSRTARLTVLSGPSGVGKGTVVAAVRRSHPQIWVSTSVTTRAPRPDEIDGVHYRFLSREQFDAMIATDALLEFAEFAGNGYGTPRAPLQRRRDAGQATLLEIDLQGARQVRRVEPDAQFVFLAPPSWADLEARLRGRGTESEERIAARLAQARVELAAAVEFDARVVNDDVERAASELVTLVQAVCPEREL